ncbi:Palmitoylated plasma membrane-bound casein kinase [Dipsacomyces acuminosporus]|nr:Palmitoylated plasma membrane-bound casein kinase [Dipsacomyces acuminosporus]
MQQATSANAATNANANNNAAKYRAQPGATERRMISRRNQLQHASPNVVGVHYRVGKRIGEGSFGVIYEGTNLIDNRPVAIKFCIKGKGQGKGKGESSTNINTNTN